MSNKLKSTLFKILKIAGISLAVLLLLLVVGVYSLRFPAVQDYVVGKALNFYKSKVNTPASLGRLYVDFPSNVTIEDLYLEDTKEDTLLYAGYITLQTDLWSLLDNKLHLSNIELDRIVGRVSRPKNDSLYNFQFIIDAFASDKKKDTTSSQPFDFSLGTVLIENSDLIYNDGYTGLKAETKLQQLNVNFSAFDLLNKQMVAERILLKGTKAKLDLFEGNPAAASGQSGSEASEPFNFDADNVEFSSVNFKLEDSNSMISLVSDIGDLQLEVDSLDINNGIYTAQKINLENSFVSFDQYSGKKETTGSATTNDEATNILAGAKQLTVSNTAFRFYDHTDSVATSGFDPTHFWLQQLEADLSDGYFENGTADVNVNQLKVTEKNRLAINQLKTEAHYGDREAFVKNLTMQTSRSFLQGDIIVSYPSINSLAEDPNNLSFDISLNQNSLHPEDILYFQPALAESLNFLKPYKPVSFTANVNGKLSKMSIDELIVDGFSKTRLKLNGNISGLPDIKNTTFDIDISELTTTRKDIITLVTDTLIPPGLTLPEQLSAKLKAKGKMNDIAVKGSLNTTLGNLKYDAHLKQNKDSLYAYNGQVEGLKLQLNKLLNNAELGKATFDLNVEGVGFQPKDLNATVKGAIASVDYKNYTYKNIEIDASGNNNVFKGNLAIDDENLAFKLDGQVNMQDTIPKYDLRLDLDRADLYALNISQSDIKLRAKLDANLSFSSLKSLKGQAKVDNMVISKEGTIYQIDTLGLNATSLKSITDITLRSPILDADFKGDFELETLPEVMKNHFDHYLNLSDSSQIESLKPQSFTFDIDFKNPVFFEEVLVPGLEEFDPTQIKGQYNSEKWLVDIEVLLKKVNYKGTEIDSFDLKLTSDENAFNLDARAAQVKQGTFAFKNLLLQSEIAGDHIKADFKILDDYDSTRYHLGGKLYEENSNYIFSFNRGEFILNYDPWRVAPQNEIVFIENSFWVNNLRFTKNQQQISLQSKTTEKQDTLLNTSFDQFNLGFLGKFKETEALVLGGILDGNINLNTSQKSLNADLSIANFSYNGDTLGNINLAATNKESSTVFDLAIKSGQNDFTANGTITQQDQTQLDIDAQIKKLNISTFESLAVNQVSELEGVISGNLAITGTVEKPDINGKLKFNETGFRVNYTGVKYIINNETLSFNNEGLSFNQFTFRDENDDKLTIDGSITSENYKNFNFNLKINSSNFELLKTTKKQNDLVYGNLAVNAKADITGTLKNPKVTVDLGVADGSNVTYTIPESQISIQEREGVVRFFDQDLEEDEFFVERKAEEDTLEVFISGVDLRANVNVTEQSTFNIVIDPITNDQLTVSGNADLSLKMRPSGDMTLTGRYEVTEGAYQLNFYGLVKRRFDIQPGSFLLWTGDPLNAQMNVTATYTVRTSAIDANVNRKIPFIVYLNIGGQLLSPDISFRLAAEEGEAPPAVQSWISGINQQESVLNQQVFSLLVFKTFTSSAFSGSGGGGVAQSTARSSVSRILSNQLNRLGQKIEGVELSFDLQSYQDVNQQGGTTGRTELELGLSKEFFDNRVIVKVAGDFDLEGSDGSRQQNASSFGGDIRIEYKLTEDGRFRLVGFRQNEYDNLLQGEIAETGVGIIFVRDYNSFKELFKKVEQQEEGGSSE